MHIWSIHCFYADRKLWLKHGVGGSMKANSKGRRFVQIQCDRKNFGHDRMMCQERQKRRKALRGALDTIGTQIVLRRFLDQIVNNVRIMSELRYFDRECVTIRMCWTVTQDEGTIIGLLKSITDCVSKEKFGVTTRGMFVERNGLPGKIGFEPSCDWCEFVDDGRKSSEKYTILDQQLWLVLESQWGEDLSRAHWHRCQQCLYLVKSSKCSVLDVLNPRRFFFC